MIEIGVDQVVQADPARRRHEPQCRLDDHPDLALAGEEHLEQLAVPARRAPDDLAVADDGTEGDDMVDLRALAERHRADPAHRERPADRLTDVVGKHGWHEVVRQRVGEHGVPPAAGAHGNAAVGDRADGSRAG